MYSGEVFCISLSRCYNNYFLISNRHCLCPFAMSFSFVVPTFSILCVFFYALIVIHTKDYCNYYYFYFCLCDVSRSYHSNSHKSIVLQVYGLLMFSICSFLLLGFPHITILLNIHSLYSMDLICILHLLLYF